MSADNGIYILQSLDGFRVIHAQGIDNLWWWPTGEYINGYPKWDRRDIINPAELYNYFNESKIYHNRESAMKEADRIYEEIMGDDFCPICEYGIQFINGLENEPFPTEGTKGEEDDL